VWIGWFPLKNLDENPASLKQSRWAVNGTMILGLIILLLTSIAQAL
jgi:hypothetical protein